ncbi:beta-lactamase-like protein [Amylostereum chailletii]|nr:beta-lactamase-like protein [Amylostereum chailletii]
MSKVHNFIRKRTPRYIRPPTFSLTFLGTASGSGPSLGRSCTAASLSLGKRQWLVDCSEGTLRQHRRATSEKIIGSLNQVERIFITHLHADHCMGIVSFMKARLPWKPTLAESHPAESTPIESEPAELTPFHLYGPKGLRTFVRFLLRATSTTLGSDYAVHELLQNGETPTSCAKDERHPNERVGRNVYPGKDGLWRGIVRERTVQVSAGPLTHRVPCVGYVFDGYSMGKLVMLGDTCDPEAIAPIARNADILVHEATAMVPPDPSSMYDLRSDTEAWVRTKAVAKGHSTARMAGEFAVAINAKQLYLNHLSFR